LIPPTHQRHQQKSPPTVFRLHDCDHEGFVAIAAAFGSTNYAYAVTPNVDHVIRYCDDRAFRDLYHAAGYVLLDSRVFSKLVRVARHVKLRVCTGSDVTEQIFSKIVSADDPIVLIGGSAQQAEQLAQRFALNSLSHLNPPMRVLNDPEAVEKCLQFIEAHSPFRFCFIAIGSPQQEVIANELGKRGVARGLTLCVGAAVNFLTGKERRAPRWMQRAGIEWAFRLFQNPVRMAHRYLIRGPRIFVLLRRIQIELQYPLKLRLCNENESPLIPGEIGAYAAAPHVESTRSMAVTESYPLS
jgi:exopolysaccharide biosynthesis WecB/TagA/CpsF family protein